VPRIGVAPISPSSSSGKDYLIPTPSDINQYPLVAVADSGISDIFKNWVVGKWEPIRPEHRDNSHATFISGLLVNGGDSNPNITEANGCRLVDICLMPKSEFLPVEYPNGLEGFIEELKMGLKVLLGEFPIRIVNLSINQYVYRSSDMYSDLAKALDQISEELNVIFVISAGNLGYIDGIAPRHFWSCDPTVNIAELSSRNNDNAYAPAESLRNISVAAINPSNDGLACYSCKGEGSNKCVKPDVVHYGGDNTPEHPGLISTDVDGRVIMKSGTSFAAPLVAKTLASLDQQIEGDVSKETLIALLIHNSIIPPAFKPKEYQSFLKDCIGYGMPQNASQILNGDIHSITLIFASRIMPKKHLEFTFTWPQCLVKNGKCYGNIKITLVSTPQLDYRFGDEMIRENINVLFGMIDSEGKHVNKVKPLFKFQNTTENEAEEISTYKWDLIDDKMEWSPIKIYKKNISDRGITGSINWFLDVKYSFRDNVSPLSTGLPFTVIVTISDPNGEAPVYDEMRYIVKSTGANISDIQTAARITQRI
jgi:hypothetical protein